MTKRERERKAAAERKRIEADRALGIVRYCKVCTFREAAPGERGRCRSCRPLSKEAKARALKPVTSLADLCDQWGVEPAGLSKALYKGTACGAWLAITLKDGTHLTPGDSRLATMTVDTEAESITIGSIVEGSDVCVDGDTLRFPFTMQDFDKVVEAVEAEVDFYWRRDNLDHFAIEPRDSCNKKKWGGATTGTGEVEVDGDGFTRKERAVLVEGIKAWCKSIYEGGDSFREGEIREVGPFLVKHYSPTDLIF